MGATYNLDDFFDACTNPGKVTVAYDAKENARLNFNLLTEKALLTFLNDRGLENIEYINTRAWDLNPHKPPDIDVDSYSFCSGNKYGYIAFMFIPKTGKWRIKSFKLNLKSNPHKLEADLHYLPFEGLNNIIDLAREEN